MIILNSIKTYPQELIDLAKRFLPTLPVSDLQSINLQDVLSDTPATTILKKYVNDFDKIDSPLHKYDKHSMSFYKAVLKSKIQCHHYTRIYDETLFKQNGLTPNRWIYYSRNMLSILEKVCNPADLTIIMKSLHQAHTEKYQHSGHLGVHYTTECNLSFASAYTSNIGGEVAMFLEENNEIWDFLSNSGFPARIDFTISVEDDCRCKELAYSVLICILSYLIWGEIVEDDYVYHGIVANIIPGNAITINKIET